MALMTVFGGTGFLGRRIVMRLVGAGEVVRVATRHPARAGAAVSPAEARRTVPIIADVRDEDSVAAAVAGADGVVNAVSAYVEKGDVTYRAVRARYCRVGAGLAPCARPLPCPRWKRCAAVRRPLE